MHQNPFGNRSLPGAVGRAYNSAPHLELYGTRDRGERVGKGRERVIIGEKGMKRKKRGWNGRKKEKEGGK